MVFKPSRKKGRAGFNLTHRFVNTVMYDLPFGQGRQSGLPLSVTYAGSSNPYLPGGGLQP